MARRHHVMWPVNLPHALPHGTTCRINPTAKDAADTKLVSLFFLFLSARRNRTPTKDSLQSAAPPKGAGQVCATVSGPSASFRM